jgi:hypothetical protein
LLIATLILVAAILTNIPGAYVERVKFDTGSSEPSIGWEMQLEHGWPIWFVKRDLGSLLVARSPWLPWDKPRAFRATELLINLSVWFVLVLLAAVAVQYWRSIRQSIWQFGMRDALVSVAIIAVGCVWFAHQRGEYLREKALLTACDARGGIASGPQWQFARVPGFLPTGMANPYRDFFERVGQFDSQGDSDLACQFRHVVLLTEFSPSPAFGGHLRQMPQLEAIEFTMVDFKYIDEAKSATVARDFPPMHSLRGVGLYATNFTDADTVWLRKCHGLEFINLSNSQVGDRGLEQLAGLSHLRVLSLSSNEISDDGCRTLARIESLEVLWLGSYNIHDAGVRELARLKNLRELNISANDSEAAYSELRRQLPACRIVAQVL